MLLLLLVVLICQLQCSVGAAGSSCSCPQQQQQRQHMPNQLNESAGRQTVLMKVRMLPTPASTVLETIKSRPAASPAAWVALIVNSTAAATAQQLGVDQSALTVSLEASLGSGLNVPVVPPSRTQAAVTALADFFQDTAGTTALLVGLTLLPRTPAAHTSHSSSARSTAGSDPGLLALATLNGPFGDLAHAIGMADALQSCPELFQLGAVLDLSAPAPAPGGKASTACAARLADRYMPVVTGKGFQQGAKAAAMPPNAAALRSAEKPVAGGTHKASIALPLEVNIKLSIQLPLPQQGAAADPDALIGRARTWLQSKALDRILQQHGLRIGAGSPAHLVTLMSPAGGAGALQGVDEVLMTSPDMQDGTTDPAAAASASSAAAGAGSEHPAQAELGQGQKRASSAAGGYSGSGMSAWGRLQPHELKPLVLGQQDEDVLAQVHQAADSGSGLAGPDDEIAKRTVLGTIIGAVLGSAALGAAAAMVGAGLLRRRRAAQAQQAQGCNTCKEQGGARNEQATPGRAASCAGRHRSRKRYLKYLQPNMSVSHLLPVTARGASHGSMTGPAAAPSSSWHLVQDSTAGAATPAAGAAESNGLSMPREQNEQQLHEATQAGCDLGCTSHQQHLLCGQPAALGQPPGSTQQAPSSAGSVLLAVQPSPAGPGLRDSQQLLQQHSQPVSAALMQQQQQQQHYMHSSFGSRLLQGLAVLRPVAADPLQQPRSRGSLRPRPPDPQQARRPWAAADSSNSNSSNAPVLARHELCSDSVSSAARLDLRAASPGLSEGSGGLTGSHSGSSSSSHSTTPSPAGEQQQLQQQQQPSCVAQDVDRGCEQAGSSAGRRRNAAAACRPSPFLHYNFAACLDP